MELLEIHTQAENGRVSFDLPAGHAALANARLVVTVVPEEVAPSASTPVGHTDWEALQRAYDSFEGHDSYPTITDAVEWQRRLRADDEKEYNR